jgi:phage repressor protein C with HTH and peptisase S24 domain
MKRRVRRQPKLSIGDGTGDIAASFPDRLRILVGRSGSVLALAQDAKVSDSSVHLWLGGSEPSREKLVKLADAAGVTVDWLAAGRGPMRADLLPEGYALVRRYKGESGVEYHGVDFLALKKDWIQSLPGTPSAEALFLTEAEGDAMAPYIEAGDLILINTSDRNFRDGIWALSSISISGASVISSDMILVRRLRAEGRATFRLLCDNKDFESPPGQIVRVKGRTLMALESLGEGTLAFRSLGRVIWKAGAIP